MILPGKTMILDYYRISTFYPPHLEVAILCHYWKGQQQIGRYVRCSVCGVDSNTRNRNGDARFIRQHRKCGLIA